MLFNPSIHRCAHGPTTVNMTRKIKLHMNIFEEGLLNKTETTYSQKYFKMLVLYIRIFSYASNYVYVSDVKASSHYQYDNTFSIHAT